MKESKGQVDRMGRRDCASQVGHGILQTWGISIQAHYKFRRRGWMLGKCGGNLETVGSKAIISWLVAFDMAFDFPDLWFTYLQIGPKEAAAITEGEFSAWQVPGPWVMLVRTSPLS